MTLPCGCEPDRSGYGYCSECTRNLHKKIWREMTPEKRAFDRHVAPDQSRELDEMVFGGCSCHINPPCGYCTSKGEDDE